MVNVPLEQLPLLFKAVLHSCKSSITKEWRGRLQASSSTAFQRCLQQGTDTNEPPRLTLEAGGRGTPQECDKQLFFLLFFLYIYFTTELNVWSSTQCTCFCTKNAENALFLQFTVCSVLNCYSVAIFRTSYSFIFLFLIFISFWVGAETNIWIVFFIKTTSGIWYHFAFKTSPSQVLSPTSYGLCLKVAIF